MLSDGNRVRVRHCLAVIALAAAMATCGPVLSAQSEPSDLGCRKSIAALTDMRSNLGFPPYLSEPNPAKRGGEFDPNRYFQAFPHLTMRDQFTLDYVYHQDGMGGYPILYARPVGQTPYPDESAYRAAGEHPDYLTFVVPQDNPEGYFEYAAFAMTANQFYLDWHANYNDWLVVCDANGVEAILQSLGTGSPPGRPMSAQQQREARAIESPLPTVAMTDETATVTMLVFTKWGGFYRRTLVIDRRDHSIGEEGNQPLVAYECGIAF